MSLEHVYLLELLIVKHVKLTLRDSKIMHAVSIGLLCIGLALDANASKSCLFKKYVKKILLVVLYWLIHIILIQLQNVSQTWPFYTFN